MVGSAEAEEVLTKSFGMTLRGIVEGGVGRISGIRSLEGVVVRHSRLRGLCGAIGRSFC